MKGEIKWVKWQKNSIYQSTVDGAWVVLKEKKIGLLNDYNRKESVSTMMQPVKNAYKKCKLNLKQKTEINTKSIKSEIEYG